MEDLGAIGTLGERRNAIRVVDATDPSQPKQGNLFGEHGSWEPKGDVYATWGTTWFPFFQHEVNGLRVAPGVGVDGRTRDLLLVSTEPSMAFESYMMNDPSVSWHYRPRHSVVWAFDITGDAASKGPNGEPKLLMCSSLGTLSENWGKGLGSAGGMLGAIRLRGGMTVWDGARWRSGFLADAQAGEAAEQWWDGQQVLTARARGDKGYFPGPDAVVASNGFYDAASAGHPSVLSGVVAEDDEGKPVGYAAMGGSDGYLMAIDTKAGTEEAHATFEGGGPYGLDARLSDLSPAINGEKARVVETLKGTYQGPNGGETGTLLLVATEPNHFWVLRPSKGQAGGYGAAQLALAVLPARILSLTTDPQKMLVGVKAANGRGYVFDLKRLAPDSGRPMVLSPLMEFATGGPFVLSEGYLYVQDGAGPSRSLKIRNIDGVPLSLWDGLPVLVSPSALDIGGGYFDDLASQGAIEPVLNVGKFNAKSLVPDVTADAPLVYALLKQEVWNMTPDEYGRQGIVGLPALRHYYPDLGQRDVTVTMQIFNSERVDEFIRLSDPGRGEYCVQAEGYLYKKGQGGVKYPIYLKGLHTHGDDDTQIEFFDDGAVAGVKRSRVFGMDASRIVHANDLITLPPAGNTKRIPFAAFRIGLLPDAQYGPLVAQMRVDRDNSYRIFLRFKFLGKQGEPESEKAMEFVVKYNATTTLFDVVRGGVWHYDREVSASDPRKPGSNPTMSRLEQVIKANPGASEGDLPEDLRARLALTPVKPKPSGDGVSQPAMESYEFKFKDLSLDLIQRNLDTVVLPGLRRRVYVQAADPIQTPTFLANRPTLRAPVYGGQLDPLGPAHQGDPYGAFGYRMAQVLNAVQVFSRSEAGDGWHDQNQMKTWALDPAAFPWERNALVENQIVDNRIRPMMNQRIRFSDGRFNPGNLMAQYWVAYPGLRSQGTPSNGLYPMHILLTRDLLVGPMGVSSEEAGLRAQRAAIDQTLAAIAGLPEKGDQGYDEDVAINLCESLKQRLTQQSTQGGGGSVFNPGLGLLQLSLNPNWMTSRGDQGGVPIQKDDPHTKFVTEDPKDWNHLWTDFNANIRSDIGQFLLEHHQAPRIDVLVNGIQNVPDEAVKGARELQARLDRLEGVASASEACRHVPVISQYNVSAKLYTGSGASKVLLDGKDILANKEDTAYPNAPTLNRDSVRLIATLRAVIQVLWDPVWIENYLIKWEGNADTEAVRTARRADGMEHLTRLRGRITLHAHSQGAIIAAVAHSRLGLFRKTDPGPWESVAHEVSLVTYGGGANMYDWGETLEFKRYAHHVNTKDPVAMVPGMGDPFQSLLRSGANLVPALLLSGHVRRIVFQPPPGLLEVWKKHRVILHDSKASIPNLEEHNFIDGYLCHVEEPDGELSPTRYAEKYTAPPRCNDLPAWSGQ